jgi:A/G-specific adenine glycosylase
MLARLARHLLDWYDRHGRTLPWRTSRDPYHVWLSEIMLQQTQVATALPYYQRFLRRLPTLEHLARARQATVLKLWEGLGYYSRARNLHAAAKQVVGEHDGQLPETVEQLQTLPGIGRYTAGAIASIAFGRDEPVVDGNVMRVLARLFCIDSDLRDARSRPPFWSLAERLLPTGRAGDFNQAMMDLGATVCTPRRPVCEDCPLQADCCAVRTGRVDQLPFKSKADPIPHHTVVAAVISRGRGRSRELLITRRDEQAMLGGLWEFPGGKVEPAETLSQALRREIREELGVTIRIGRTIATVDHAYSHFRITLHAMAARIRTGQPIPRQGQAMSWVRPDQLDRYAFPAANRKIIETLVSQSQT